MVSGWTFLLVSDCHSGCWSLPPGVVAEDEAAGGRRDRDWREERREAGASRRGGQGSYQRLVAVDAQGAPAERAVERACVADKGWVIGREVDEEAAALPAEDCRDSAVLSGL